MTEAIRSRLDSELDPQEMRICFTVCDGFSRYPVDLVVKTNISWDQLVEAWYEKASVAPHWDARKYPREASAYEMHDVHNRPVTSMDGIDRVFAYYEPAEFVAPKTPPPALATPSARKKIKTFLTAHTSGGTVELLPVAKYDEAIPMARSTGGVPEDWDITIVEAKPDMIRMLCAAGHVTPEMLAVPQYPKTQLNLLPATPVIPETAMVKVIYHHIDGDRKPERAYVQMRVNLDTPEQELLERWIRHVLTGKDHREIWIQRPRAMSKKAVDYRRVHGGAE